MTQESAQTSQPSSINDLVPKMRLQGTVRETRLHGVAVDIGLEYEGFLHISQLSSNHVNRVCDVVQAGDSVAVWVSSVHPEQGRIGLTLIEPPEVSWNELAEGQVYSGTVTRIESYGAFVDIGAERPGLLHVREMAAGYIEHPSELVDLDSEVEVRVLKLDRRRRRIDLTMIGLETKAPDEPEEPSEQEPDQTTMELALQRAYAEDKEAKPHREEKQLSGFAERQDIVARTVERHSK